MSDPLAQLRAAFECAVITGALIHLEVDGVHLADVTEMLIEFSADDGMCLHLMIRDQGIDFTVHERNEATELERICSSN